MQIDINRRFIEAMKSFEESKFKKALEEFSSLTLILALAIPEDEDSDQDLNKSMEMAIASYAQIDPVAVKKIVSENEGDLWNQFFHVMRHSMDYTQEDSEKKVIAEISAPIPLGSADERSFSTDENLKESRQKKIGPFYFAVTAAQGPREDMQDTYVALELIVSKPKQKRKKIQFFGLFDGHGGTSCAYYAKQRLPELIKIEFQKKPDFSDVEIYNLLRRVFVGLNEEWFNLPFQKTRHQDFSGTTAVVALIIEQATLWIANVGDSRALILERENAIQLSEDAKATEKKYQKEIFLRGGHVQMGRVTSPIGSLDMARSIGDLNHTSVSALPTLRKFNLDQLNEGINFLVLACDGLWDVVSPPMAVEVSQTCNSAKDLADKLLKLAYVRGSTDNVTVMTVKLT